MNPSFPGPSRGEGNSDSRTENQQAIERDNVAREEEASNDVSSIQQRGTTFSATEMPVATPEEQANNRIGITPVTLRMLRIKQEMKSRELPVAVANNNPAQLIPFENILGLISPISEEDSAWAGMVTVYSDDEIAENNDIKPIAMSDYLDVLRKERREQQDLSLAAINLEDDRELEQSEIALNRVVLQDGTSPKELRMFRALENFAISNSFFAETYWTAMRRRFERDNNTGSRGEYMAQFQAREATQNFLSAALLAEEAGQERKNAITAVIESEGRDGPAAAIPIEETSLPSLTRQTDSF